MKKIIQLTTLFIASSGLAFSQGNGIYAGTISNCIARWTFDNTSSFIVDSSGNNNNGLLSNTTPANGWRNMPGQGVKFNGTSSKGLVPNSVSLQVPGDMTIIALVKFDGFYNGLCQGNEILAKGYGDRTPGTYLMRTSDNKYDGSCDVYSPTKNIMESSFGEETSIPTAIVQPYVDMGKWYFFAATLKNGVERQLFQAEMDIANYAPPAQAMTTISTAGYNIGVNSSDLTFGYSSHPSTPFWFNGVMDEVALFNKTLSVKEIRDAYTFLWNKGLAPSATKDVNILAKEIQYFVKDKQLHLAANTNNQYNIMITDVLGRKINESKLNSQSTIDLGHYAQQIFVVNVMSKDGGHYAFKVMN